MEFTGREGEAERHLHRHAGRREILYAVGQAGLLREVVVRIEDRELGGERILASPVEPGGIRRG